MKLTLKIECNSLKEFHNHLKDLAKEAKEAIKKEELIAAKGIKAAWDIPYSHMDNIFNEKKDRTITIGKG